MDSIRLAPSGSVYPREFSASVTQPPSAVDAKHRNMRIAMIFFIGFAGVLIRRNILVILMSIELMLNAVNLNFIAFSRKLSDLTGQVFSIFVITIAAGEAAIGLALTISLFRQRKTLNVEEASTMRG